MLSVLGKRLKLSPLDMVDRFFYVCRLVEARDPTQSNTYDYYLLATKIFVVGGNKRRHEGM